MILLILFLSINSCSNSFYPLCEKVLSIAWFKLTFCWLLLLLTHLVTVGLGEQQFYIYLIHHLVDFANLDRTPFSSLQTESLCFLKSTKLLYLLNHLLPFSVLSLTPLTFLRCTDQKYTQYSGYRHMNVSNSSKIILSGFLSCYSQ